jgi:hypothetical protein
VSFLQYVSLHARIGTTQSYSESNWPQHSLLTSQAETSRRTEPAEGLIVNVSAIYFLSGLTENSSFCAARAAPCVRLRSSHCWREDLAGGRFHWSYFAAGAVKTIKEARNGTVHALQMARWIHGQSKSNESTPPLRRRNLLSISSVEMRSSSGLCVLNDRTSK